MYQYIKNLALNHNFIKNFFYLKIYLIYSKNFFIKIFYYFRFCKGIWMVNEIMRLGGKEGKSS
jgi:hypothetical protein